MLPYTLHPALHSCSYHRVHTDTEHRNRKTNILHFMKLVGVTTGNNEVSWALGSLRALYLFILSSPRSGCLLFRTLAIFTRGFSRHEHFVRAVEGARLTAYSARSGRARRAHGAPPDHISPRLSGRQQCSASFPTANSSLHQRNRAPICAPPSQKTETNPPTTTLFNRIHTCILLRRGPGWGPRKTSSPTAW